MPIKKNICPFKGLKISADGSQLSYIAPFEGVLNLWLSNPDGSDAKPVTRDRGRGIRSYFWAEDARYLFYMQDIDGDEDWHIYRLNILSEETEDITPFKKIQARVISTSSRVPGRIILSLNQRDANCHDLYSYHIENNSLELIQKNPGNIISWLTDNDLNLKAATFAGAEGEYILKRYQEQKFTELVTWQPEDNNSSAEYISNKENAIYLFDSRSANTLGLVRLDLKTNQFQRLESDDRYDATALLVDNDNEILEAIAFQKERIEWKVLSKSIEKDLQVISSFRDADFSIIDRDKSKNTWLVAFISDINSTEYAIYDRKTSGMKSLFTNRPDLDKFTLAPMAPISFKARDGLLIEGYLTLPTDYNSEPVPLVLNVHGGPWGRDSWGLHNEAQWLANRGYACLQVNFRGSTGYGKNHLNAGNKEWGAKMHDDLVDAVNWAISEKYTKAGMLAIYGGSYGGYAALVGAAFTPGLFSCAIDIVGPSNLVTLINSIPPYWKPLKKTFDIRVGSVETEKEFLESRSPLFKVDQINSPLMIAQGANDPRVKQAESEQIVSALKDAGKEVVYLLYKDEGHGFAKPENRIHFYTEAEKFLQKYLPTENHGAGQ